MTWFKYLKSNEIISPSTQNTNYSYPLCKRQIYQFTPKDTLSINSWIFLDISDYSINEYFDINKNIQYDDTSYLVTYEKLDKIYPVKSIIHNKVLYFQTYEEHTADNKIDGIYCLYYNAPNIRKINSINNGGVNDYQINVTSPNPYYGLYSEINSNKYLVNLSSTSSYNFSFLNSNLSWTNGFTNSIGATCYINFSGPSITIYGNKDYDYGKFKIQLVGLTNKKYPVSAIELDSFVVDCYSTFSEENVILYENNSLNYRDYNLKLEVISEKNTISKNNKIKLNSFSFNYNTYIDFEKEIINPNAVFVSTGSIK